MKLPFRFHRGEFNGYYLKHLVTFLNYAVDDVKAELVYWCNVQFKTSAELTSGDEIAMRDSDILGICKIAGVFPSYLAGGTWYGTVFMTESKVVGSKQRSERGLYNKNTDSFDFIRTESDDYPTDISTEASADRRQTLVPTGAAVEGYARSTLPVYDSNGNVIEANLDATQQPDMVSEPFYGENYSTLSSDANVITAIPVALTKSVFEIMQYIRYNGPSIKSFFEVTERIVGMYVYDINIVYQDYHYVVQYKLNDAITMQSRAAHLQMWKNVVDYKFKLFELYEVI